MPMEEDAVTRAELDRRIERTWGELESLVEGLDPRALETEVVDGWTVKDHLLHLVAWEESLLALLEGRDRAAAMGVPGMGDAGVDAMNAGRPTAGCSSACAG
jgi:hypothetical protein